MRDEKQTQSNRFKSQWFILALTIEDYQKKITRNSNEKNELHKIKGIA